jgi:hypothetical protein
MKQFTRIFSLVMALTLAFSFANAQNLMTKAQKLGLKTNTVNVTVDNQINTASREVLLEEGFDVDFLPTGWTQEIVNTTNTWVQTNPEENNFNTIDPASLFSAMVAYDAAVAQDEWLISPSIDAAGETPLRVEWYAGVSGSWLDPGATIKLHVSADGGTTWTELWNAIDVVEAGAPWAWYPVTTDLSAYAAAPFQLAWQYVGQDGDLAGIDGVVIKSGADYVYQSDFEEFTAGEYLVDNDDSGFWTTWSDTPGTAEDAFVVDEQSASPSNSVEMEGTSDLVFKMGNKTSGVYQYNIKYWIETDFGGYINLQHFEAPGTEWAVEVYFGATGDGYVNAGVEEAAVFTYTPETWMQLEFFVDLDNDWATFTLDGTLIHEWEFHVQANDPEGTLQLGGSNIFAGAPTGETPHFYFDDLEFIVIAEGTTPPIINVDSAPVAVVVESGNTKTETFSIANDGVDDLEYVITPVYSLGNKAMNKVPAGVSAAKALDQTFTASPVSMVSNELSDRDVTLNYDGDPASAIGSETDYEYRLAARFPADMVTPYIGTELNKVDVFIRDPGTAYKLQIYDMGNIHTPGPGELLVEQTFTDNGPEAWVTVELDNPVFIEGGDIWVGYWLTSNGGSFTPGCDEGPVNLDGDWFATGPGWQHLSNNPDLQYNWNIRANLTGSPITKWLSTDITEGTLAGSESTDITMTLDATDLDSDIYSGKLVVRSNDLANDMVSKTITMNVIVGVDENGIEENVVVYPNPASDYLRIGTNGEISNIRIVNTIGQVVLDQNVGSSNYTLSTENMPKGVYFVNIETLNGTTTQKVIVE